MAVEIKRQKELNPGLVNKEHMRLATVEWNKLKAKKAMAGSKTTKKAAPKGKKPAPKKAPAKKGKKNVEEDELISDE